MTKKPLELACLKLNVEVHTGMFISALNENPECVYFAISVFHFYFFNARNILKVNNRFRLKLSITA